MSARLERAISEFQITWGDFSTSIDVDEEKIDRLIGAQLRLVGVQSSTPERVQMHARLAKMLDNGNPQAKAMKLAWFQEMDYFVVEADRNPSMFIPPISVSEMAYINMRRGPIKRAVTFLAND